MRTDAPSPSRLCNAALAVVPRLATFLFNYVQLGLVVAVARSQAEHSVDVVILVAFEFGILLDCFFRRGTMFVWGLIALGSGIGLLVSDALPSEILRLFVATISAGLLSMSLKKIRTSTDALGKIKRRWRALGYLLAGLYSTIVVILLLLPLFAAVFISAVRNRQDERLPEPFRLDAPRLRPYLVVMLHHLHYFAYAYLMVFMFRAFDVPDPALGPLFYVGWLGYYVFIHAEKHHRQLVVGGHAIASMAVLLMLGVNSFPALLALWLLTGIGGGTIILLREANIHDDEATYERFKTWEAFGHVLGLICLSASVMTGRYDVAFLISGAAGLLCAAGAAIARANDTNHQCAKRSSVVDSVDADPIGKETRGGP